MYRLILYYLILLVVVGFIYSIFDLLPFAPFNLAFSTIFLLLVCFLSNKFFEKIFSSSINLESLYITALILVLIITPVKVFNLSNLVFLFLVSFFAMASKYILAIKKKHVFNPAAIAVLLTAYLIHGYASWWVGTLVMLPFTFIGIFIVRKIRRFDLVFYFFVGSVLGIFVNSFLKGNTNILLILKNTFIETPIFFFAFVMLTEPLTTPSTSLLQSFYGFLVGILFIPGLDIGPIFFTPELALVLGNIFSYLVSPKFKLILSLKEKEKLTSSIYDFVFSLDRKIDFIPGQYMEWTLGQKKTDVRGNRRYFTIASSPTENELRIGVKFNENGSSFKKEMLGMKKGRKIIASQLAGDFTLPSDNKKKLVFVAGGIGVTPFRSMIKFLIDRKERRDITLLYNEKNISDMVYKEMFEEAKEKIGLKLIYFETERRGHMVLDVLKKEIPDFKDRTFYISGSHGVIESFKGILKKLGLPRSQMKTDYFPGF